MEVEIVFGIACEEYDDPHICIDSDFWDDIDFSGITFKKGTIIRSNGVKEEIVATDRSSEQRLLDTINIDWSTQPYFALILKNGNPRLFMERFAQWDFSSTNSEHDDSRSETDSDTGSDESFDNSDDELEQLRGDSFAGYIPPPDIEGYPIAAEEYGRFAPPLPVFSQKRKFSNQDDDFVKRQRMLGGRVPLRKTRFL